MDSELDSKIDSYFKQHISNTKIEYEDSCDYKVVGHPKLHLLRLVQSGNNITIYFSNRGDKVFNIDVTSSDVLSISIEPKDNILDNTTGCIKFMTNNISDNKITFILNYTDGKLNSVSKKYLISILDKKMEEVY